MKTTDPTDLLGFLIHDLSRLMSRVFERQPGTLKISRTQARVLAYVALYEGANHSEIAGMMDVQKIVLTKLVDDLEAQALIVRRLDQSDRRVKRLYMAPGAQPVLAAIWEQLSVVSDIGLAALPTKKRQADFLRDLRSVRRHLMDSLNNTQESGTRL